MSAISPPRTLLDWKAEAAQDLAIMRLNTERWQRTGVLKTPAEVRVRKTKKMSNTVKKGRKGHGG